MENFNRIHFNPTAPTNYNFPITPILDASKVSIEIWIKDFFKYLRYDTNKLTDSLFRGVSPAQIQSDSEKLNLFNFLTNLYSFACNMYLKRVTLSDILDFQLDCYTLRIAFNEGINLAEIILESLKINDSYNFSFDSMESVVKKALNEFVRFYP